MKFEVSQLRSEITPGLQQSLELSVAAGETVCISGASGIGKSILLRCFADLLPHTGEMKLNGESSVSMPANEWRRRVCLLPAESQWWFVGVKEHFIKSENGAEQSCNAIDDEFEQSCFRQLGFSPEVLQWRIDRLSTGEKQRLSLLRVFNRKPEVLLLDEPTASLDPLSIRKAEACIASYKQKTQCAVIWVSHDPAQIRRVADRHVYLDATGFSERAR